jgi:hypothetical protein
MGEFLAMSGVSKASRRDVLHCLEEFALSHGGKLTPAPGGQPYADLVVSGEDFSPLTIMYPDQFLGWDEASQYLSTCLGVPVISLHIHDGDLWMYTLYRDGEEIDQFNPIPDYWSAELSPEERSSWEGNASVVAQCFEDVEVPSIEKYLVTWNLDTEEPGKAYEDDEFPFNDCWQLTDFMSKLGLVYPIAEHGQAKGETYTFEVTNVS